MSEAPKEITNRRTVDQAARSEDRNVPVPVGDLIGGYMVDTIEDGGAPPGLALKVMLIRLRMEMSAAARALQGELRDEFWQLVDDLQAMRPKSP